MRTYTRDGCTETSYVRGRHVLFGLFACARLSQMLATIGRDEDVGVAARQIMSCRRSALLHLVPVLPPQHGTGYTTAECQRQMQ